jgi:hypothetical protein
MDIEELNRKLAEVKKGVTLFDTIIDQDWESGESRVTKKQAEYVRKIMRSDLKESNSPKKKEIICAATKKLNEFMKIIVQLDDDDWDTLSNDMGENEQICWQQIEMLIEYLENLG